MPQKCAETGGFVGETRRAIIPSSQSGLDSLIAPKRIGLAESVPALEEKIQIAINSSRWG